MSEVKLVPASSFVSAYPQLARETGSRVCFTGKKSISFSSGSELIICAEECLAHVPPMPHPMRALVNDEDVVVVFIPVWVDNVSGNSTKAYNKHINMYMQNSNLPGRLLNQEFFVHFVATSQHATSSEQMSALTKLIK